MDFNLSDLIGNVCFPIVLVVYMEMKNKKQSETYKKERISFIKAIRSNTEVLIEIKNYLLKGGE